MKLLKYVVKSDTGLAPNPYFDVCSLALCTPNHMNARLVPGDWVVGHSCKSTGYRLVYAMQLTRVLSMNEYFRDFPNKCPDPYGNVERQYGDNIYFQSEGRWQRVPSAQHNSEDSFRQDQGRCVYLSEGTEHYWYFGAANPASDIQGFSDRFPWLIQERQGFSFVRGLDQIQKFSDWLSSLGRRGVVGVPRDQQSVMVGRYLIAIDPKPVWRRGSSDVDLARSTARLTGC